MSDNNYILITGATSGIGMETARYLSDQGFELILVGRNSEKLKSVAEQVGNQRYVVADLEDLNSVKRIFDYCKNNSLKLNGLVHSAGYAINMPIRNLDLNHAEKQMAVHYYAFLELCKHFYSRKISNDGASIVALSSIASSTKLKGSVVYAASKNALNTAVSVAAKEFIKRSIRVNALMPAYVDTRMNAGLEELIDLREKQPLGFIPPREIAYMIEFLLSNKSRYITGALIPISAGMEF